MEKHTIGLNADHIWQILSDNEPHTYEQLKEESRLAERDLNMALGWLAREDQIETKANDVILFLKNRKSI